MTKGKGYGRLDINYWDAYILFHILQDRPMEREKEEMKTNHQRNFKGKRARHHHCQSWSQTSEFSDISIDAHIGCCFANGNRGEARSVRGAKKFIRSRIRFHDKMKMNQIMKEL